MFEDDSTSPDIITGDIDWACNDVLDAPARIFPADAGHYPPFPGNFDHYTIEPGFIVPNGLEFVAFRLVEAGKQDKIARESLRARTTKLIRDKLASTPPEEVQSSHTWQLYLSPKSQKIQGAIQNGDERPAEVSHGVEATWDGRSFPSAGRYDVDNASLPSTFRCEVACYIGASGIRTTMQSFGPVLVDP